jgi:hypothetical protein
MIKNFSNFDKMINFKNMKNCIAILICLLNACIINNAQTVNDIFSASDPKITMCGVDFTHVKILGENDALTIRNVYFSAINTLLMTEQEKYNFRTALKKGYVEYNMDEVYTHNMNRNIENMLVFSNNIPPMPFDTIKQIIKSYKFPDKTGVGLMIIMESMDKPGGISTMDVVFFNMATKDILLSEKMSGVVGGFGFRNFYARSIYNVINEIRDVKYDQWKKKYAGSNKSI